jgi:heptosyltransferase-2
MNKPKKILIFGNMGIGNLIMFIPTIKLFRDHFPKTSFFLTVSKKHFLTFKEILHPLNLIDEFILFNGKYATPLERMKYINKIRKEKFDMLVKNFLIGINFMIELPNIPYRVGHISSPDFPMRGDSLLNYKVKMKRNEHEIQRNLRLFYAITKEEAKLNPKLSFKLEPNLEINKFFNLNNRPLIGIQIGSSRGSSWKEWSLLKFGTLTKELIDKYNAKVVLLGDLDAKKKGKVVEKMAPKSINLIGKTTIMEAAAIIRQCKVLVSNDAGLVWISQAVRTPVIAIYGPTDFRRSRPLGINDKIIRKDLPCSPCYKSPVDYKKAVKCRDKKCLNLITSQEVLQEVVRLADLR